MAEPRRHVVVVGGGITGLAAAHRLVVSGQVEVTLVEADARLGGKVRTDHAGGFVVESGPDSFVAGKESVLDLAAELGISDLVVASRPEHRGTWVYSGGALHPLPEGLILMAPARLGPMLRSPLLSWKGKLRMLGDLVVPRGTGEDESLESYVTRRLGREVLERIAQPLVAGIHAAEPHTMSLAASFPRLLDLERQHRSLILGARRVTRNAPSQASHFASFRDGMGTLVTALEKSIVGVDTRTGVEGEGLSSVSGGFEVRLGDGSSVRADAVVLAVPAAAAARLVSGLSPEAASAIGRIRQVAVSTVTLGYRATDLPLIDGYGFVVPSAERRRISGATFLSQKWDGRAPEGHATVRGFIGGVSGQELAVAPPEQQVAAMRRELHALAGISAEPVFVRTQPWAGGLHQYTLGHLERVAAAEAALSAHPGIRLAGAAFHGIGLNECIRSGQAAATALLNP